MHILNTSEPYSTLPFKIVNFMLHVFPQFLNEINGGESIFSSLCSMDINPWSIMYAAEFFFPVFAFVSLGFFI